MFLHYLATTIYFILYALLLFFAFRYLLTDSYQHHYAKASGQEWRAVDPAMQQIVWAMMKVIGAGMLTTSITGALLALGAALTGLAWLKDLAPVPAVVFCAPTLYASYIIRKNGAAAAPVAPSLIGLGLALAGFALSWI